MNLQRFASIIAAAFISTFIIANSAFAEVGYPLPPGSYAVKEAMCSLSCQAAQEQTKVIIAVVGVLGILATIAGMIAAVKRKGQHHKRNVIIGMVVLIIIGALAVGLYNEADCSRLQRGPCFVGTGS